MKLLDFLTKINIFEAAFQRFCLVFYFLWLVFALYSGSELQHKRKSQLKHTEGMPRKLISLWGGLKPVKMDRQIGTGSISINRIGRFSMCLQPFLKTHQDYWLSEQGKPNSMATTKKLHFGAPYMTMRWLKSSPTPKDLSAEILTFHF